MPHSSGIGMLLKVKVFITFPVVINVSQNVAESSKRFPPCVFFLFKKKIMSIHQLHGQQAY